MKLRYSQALLIVAGLAVAPVFAADKPKEPSKDTAKNEPKSGASKVEMIPSVPAAPARELPHPQPAPPAPPEAPEEPAEAPAAPGAPATPAPAKAVEPPAPAWDYRAIAEWRRLLASDPIVSVAFAPNGTVAGGGDGRVFLWSQQGDLLATYPTEATSSAPEPPKDPKDDLLGQKPPPPPAAKVPIKLLVFSPDGRILATSSDSTVKLWNAENGAWLKTLAGHQGPVTSIVFTPDSRAIATGSMDKNIKLWAVATGQMLGTLAQHVYPIRAVAFSPDVKTLISVGARGEGNKNAELKIWDVAGKGDLLLETTLDRVSANSVQLVAQGRILAAGGDGSLPTVNLWDAPAAKFVRSTKRPFKLGDDVTSLAFSPDFSVVAGGGERKGKSSRVWLWEVKTGRLLREIKATAQNALAFSPDGRVLAVAGEDRSVQLWRVP